MKKYLLALMIAFASMSVVVADAEAKRMGGGGSFGRQSPAASRQATQPQQPAQATRPAQGATPAAAPAARPSPWRGLLGGALLGLGLGALLSSLGIGGALASIIGTVLTFALIGLAIMFIVRMIRRKSGANTGANAGMQPAYAGANAQQKSAYTPEIGSRINQGGVSAQPAGFQGAAAGAVAGAPYGIPADFDVQGFVRHAKTHYIRLQAAWDKADVNDIREFTTPEMFAELKMQLQERGASPNHTDVMALDAEMLGIETVGTDYLASVKFTGMVKEEQGASAVPFAEIWNLAKPVSGGGWMLAGIQQVPDREVV